MALKGLFVYAGSGYPYSFETPHSIVLWVFRHTPVFMIYV